MDTIELYDDDDYVVEAVLDGKLFHLHMSWNSTLKYWTMEIQDYTRKPVLSGIRVLPNTPLIGRYISENTPQGEFLVLSDSETIAKSDFADGYAEMIYASWDEVNAK